MDEDDASSIYSRDEHSNPLPPTTTAAQRKKKRKGGKKHRRAGTPASAASQDNNNDDAPELPFLAALNAHLARGEHVVDSKKVLAEAEAAEARGESFDMIARIKALQDGSAADSGPLVDAIGPWLRGPKAD